MTVDTLGNLLVLHITPANDQRVEVAFVDHSYTGDVPEQAAAAHVIQLIVVKLPETKHGFVVLPRRWVIERSNACISSPSLS